MLGRRIVASYGPWTHRNFHGTISTDGLSAPGDVVAAPGRRTAIARIAAFAGGGCMSCTSSGADQRRVYVFPHQHRRNAAAAGGMSWRWRRLLSALAIAIMAGASLMADRA